MKKLLILIIPALLLAQTVTTQLAVSDTTRMKFWRAKYDMEVASRAAEKAADAFAAAIALATKDCGLTETTLYQDYKGELTCPPVKPPDVQQ